MKPSPSDTSWYRCSIASVRAESCRLTLVVSFCFEKNQMQIAYEVIDSIKPKIASIK